MSRSQGSKVWQAWKGIVSRDVCAKHKRTTSISIAVKINFQNLNTVFDT